MCLADEVLSRITGFHSDFLDTADAYVKAVSTDVAKVASDFLVFGQHVITVLSKEMRSTEGLDTLMRLGTDGIEFADLIEQTENVVRPILLVCSHVASAISAGRIIYSLNYIVTGKLYNDINEGHVLPLISQAAFLLRRTFVTTNWLFEHGLLKIDLYAEVSKQAAAIPVFSAFNAIPKKEFLDGVLVVGLIPLAIGHANSLLEGKDVVYNLSELANISLDIFLAVLRMASVNEPYVVSGLSLISAGAGVLAIFYNPANNPQKRPEENQ